MPSGCGIGGDAFWLIWDEATGHAVRPQRVRPGAGRAQMPPACAPPACVSSRGGGPLSISVPGAVRSWGDAHARHGRLDRATILAPAIELARAGFPAWDGFIAAVEGTAPRVLAEIGPDAGFFEVYRPHGRPWRPGERVRLPALATTLETLATEGFDAFYDGDLGERQARGLEAAGSPIRVGDLRGHTSTWGEPIATDYRGVRVTSHPPNSSGVVALEILAILARSEAPPAAAFGPDGVTDPGLDPSRHRGVQAGDGGPRRLSSPTRRSATCRSSWLLGAEHAAELAARIDPRRAARPAAATNPPGGGTIYLATVDADGQRRQPHRVELPRLRVRGRGPGDRHPLPEPGQLLQPGPGPSQRPRARQADAPHAPARDALPGRRATALDRGRVHGRRRPAADPRPVRVGGRGRRRSTSGRPSRHRAGTSSRTDHFQPPVEVRLEPRHAAGIAAGARGARAIR